jgi:ribosomal protein L37AE/L43A
LWPNIRFLPSIVAEKNATKNEHICSMCIKINKVGKQEVGIWWLQKCYPQYGIPIWCLWPNIRFLPSTVTEKNAMKNILDGRKDRQMDRGKTVYPPPPSGTRGIITKSLLVYCAFLHRTSRVQNKSTESGTLNFLT